MYSNEVEITSHEEQIIRELVDDIYQAEAKISEINQAQTESPSKEQYKQIEELQLKVFTLKEKLKQASSEKEKEIASKEKIIQQKQSEIDDVNNEINDLKKKLIQFNPVSFKSVILSGYAVNNANKFLTGEQIEEVLTQSKGENNSVQLQKLKIESESKENFKKEINENILKTQMRLNEIEENLKMRKEEKITTREELINIISQKESLEELIKFTVASMIAKESKTNSNYGSNDEKQVQLYQYEMVNIEPTKASNFINDNVMEIIDSQNSYSDLMSSNNESMNSLVQTKDYLQNIIRSEITNYIKSIKVMNSVSTSAVSINNFLSSLSNIIINTIMTSNSSSLNLDNFNNNITSSSMIQFLLYCFKLLFYENIIEQKIQFTTREYKQLKKESKKQIDQLSLTIAKLKAKIEDIEAKQKEISSEINLISTKEAKKQCELSSNEKGYIEICTKGNIKEKQKEELWSEIALIKTEIKKLVESCENNKNSIEKEIADTNDKIAEIKKGIENEKLSANEEIIKLRKLIADKFNIIKSQLHIYKTKHGSNLAIYNRLIDSINSTIKSTTSSKIKSPSKDEKTFSVQRGFMNNSVSNDEFSTLGSGKKNQYKNRSAIVSGNLDDSYEQINNGSYAPDATFFKKVQSSNFKQLQINKMSISIDQSLQRNLNNISIQSGTNFNITPTSKSKEFVKEFKSKHHRTNSAYSKPKPIDMNAKRGNSGWIDEKDKLTKTILSIKEKISKSEKANTIRNLNYNHNNVNISKISPLTQITFCYYRVYKNDVNAKYNPLNSPLVSQLTVPPYNFIKGTISLNKNFNSIFVSPSISLTAPFEIKIESVDNSIVNSTIKKIIEIHREYRKVRAMNPKVDFDLFCERSTVKQFKMNKAEVIKAATNKNFNFSLLISHTSRIEIILGNYEDFKMWINGIAFLLKHKSEIIKK